MAQYLTPGVYLRPKPRDERDVRLVRTDIAGFVGFAERGVLPAASMSEAELKRVPHRVNSWKDFRAHFGGFIPNGLLAYGGTDWAKGPGNGLYVLDADTGAIVRVLRDLAPYPEFAQPIWADGRILAADTDALVAWSR